MVTTQAYASLCVSELLIAQLGSSPSAVSVDWGAFLTGDRLALSTLSLVVTLLFFLKVPQNRTIHALSACAMPLPCMIASRHAAHLCPYGSACHSREEQDTMYLLKPSPCTSSGICKLLDHAMLLLLRFVCPACAAKGRRCGEC